MREKMGKSVKFRHFQPRDVDSIHRWKNDPDLNSLTVGEFKPFSRADAERWVRGCMGEHENYQFWAICTNDDEERIIGWASIADIDYINSSASTHSIVIGDENYHDGFAWIETVLFMFEFVFEKLKLNRLYGVSLVGHPMSNKIGDIMYMAKEGILRQAIFKNGKYYDILYNAILKEEYFLHKEKGDFEMRSILKRLRNLRHG